MRNLISHTVDGKVNMHRTIDQFVFNFFVKEGSDFNACWTAFFRYVAIMERGNYNQTWFTQDRLMHDVTEVWGKFERNKDSRKDKNLKGNSLLEIVMNLFHRADKQDIFVSQTACARVLETNQMAISRELKSLVEQGVLNLVERGSKMAKKCSVYSLAEKGLTIFSKMFEKVKKVMNEIVGAASDAMKEFQHQLEVLRKNATVNQPKMDGTAKREKEIEYLRRRREILL